MKIRQIAYVVLLSGLTGCFGYWLHGQSEESGSFAAAKSLPQLEYLIVPESFSRVENTRKTLEGLCARLRLEVQGRLWMQKRAPAQPGASREVSKTSLEGIIRDLEREIKEFAGTDEELYLVEDLFCVLKRAERFDRWVDLYLKALYEHPMHPVVARFAREAVSMGKAAGRQNEVLSGLTHLGAIPCDFEGKAKVSAVLVDANRRNQLAGDGVGVRPTVIN